jgi:hypothetical protein
MRSKYWVSLAMAIAACAAGSVVVAASSGKSAPQRATVAQIDRQFPILTRLNAAHRGRLNWQKLRKLPIGTHFWLGQSPALRFQAGFGITSSSYMTLIYRSRSAVAAAGVSPSAGLCYVSAGSSENSGNGRLWCGHDPMTAGVGWFSDAPGRQTAVTLIPKDGSDVQVMWEDGHKFGISARDGIATFTANKPFVMSFKAANGTRPGVATSNYNGPVPEPLANP